MIKVQAYLEKQAFGVCAFIGEKVGIASSAIRLSFIYLSFITFGSPLILYLIIAFLMNIHKHLRKSRSTVWDF